MIEHAVTPAQAQLLAQCLQAQIAASERAADVLRTLTLGTPCAGLTLVDVNVETGILTCRETPDAG